MHTFGHRGLESAYTGRVDCAVVVNAVTPGFLNSRFKYPLSSVMNSVLVFRGGRVEKRGCAIFPESGTSQFPSWCGANDLSYCDAARVQTLITFQSGIHRDPKL